MISNLELKQFRGLEHVRFENLGRANLIIGGNNTGKTSILEALVLLLGDSEQGENLPSIFREPPSRSSENGFWPFVITGEDPEKFEIRADNHSIAVVNKQHQLFIQRWDSDTNSSELLMNMSVSGWRPSIKNYFPKLKTAIVTTRHSDPACVSEMYNQIAPLNPDNEAKLEELLRAAVDPRLRRLRYAKPQGTGVHLVYVDIGEGAMLPMTQFGQAFIRTLQIYCEIFANRPKIILIDEIENGLYYEGMEDFWKGLMAVLEDQDVQLFATTHSRECMEAAQKAASGMAGDPLRFVRLDRMVDDPSRIVGTTFGKREMETAIEFKTEMR